MLSSTAGGLLGRRANLAMNKNRECTHRERDMPSMHMYTNLKHCFKHVASMSGLSISRFFVDDISDGATVEGAHGNSLEYAVAVILLQCMLLKTNPPLSTCQHSISSKHLFGSGIE